MNPLPKTKHVLIFTWLILHMNFSLAQSSYTPLTANTTLSNVAGKLRIGKIPGAGTVSIGAYKDVAVSAGASLVFTFDYSNVTLSSNPTASIAEIGNPGNIQSQVLTANGTYTLNISSTIAATFRIQFSATTNNKKSFDIDNVNLAQTVITTTSNCVDYDDYRYGFNGKEKDDETFGKGNEYDFGARIYDPRLGRWFSADPERQHYPGMSPYSGFGDNPVYFKDKEGGLLTDKDGKPIFIDGGSAEIPFNTGAKDADGNEIRVIAKVKIITYFTNEGNPITSYDIDQIRTETIVENRFTGELQTVSNQDNHSATEKEKMDCHGFTFIGNKNPEIKAWLNNPKDIEKILRDDKWLDITDQVKKEGITPDNFKVGDIIIISNEKGVSHSAIFNGKSFDSKEESGDLVTNRTLGGMSKTWKAKDIIDGKGDLVPGIRFLRSAGPCGNDKEAPAALKDKIEKGGKLKEGVTKKTVLKAVKNESK